MAKYRIIEEIKYSGFIIAIFFKDRGREIEVGRI